MNTATTASARTYPRTCVRCRRKTVNSTTVDRVREVKYDGAKYALDLKGLPAEQCANCGFTTFGKDADRHIDLALRQHIGLLTPEQILAARTNLNLTQRQLGEAIGCAHESISRWESGVVVQSRAYDRWMRAYFQVPEVRSFFASLESGAALTAIQGAVFAAGPVVSGLHSSPAASHPWKSAVFGTSQNAAWQQSHPLKPQDYRVQLAA